MKILVTGGSGFIGANLCERLLKEGNQVTCLDNFFSSAKSNIEEYLQDSNFSLVEQDIINPINLENDFEQIYHLACPASPPRYQADHIYTLKTCFQGTLNLLTFALSHEKVPKFLFTSTSEVYGDPLQHPQTETDRGNVNPHGPRSCYDEGKRVAESLCMNFYRQHNIPLKIVRIFNTYGPKMDPEDGRVVSNFICQSLKGEKITIYGNGRQTRSFQYIDDLLDAMIAYMDLEEDFPGPINLGNPSERTILNLAENIIKIINSKEIQLEFKELPSDDPTRRCPNISLAKNKLNWQPKIRLEQGLIKTIEYFKSLISQT